MTGKRVSAKELAEAKDIMARYDNQRTNNISAKQFSEAHRIEFMNFLEETKDMPIYFCDSWIYSVMMQVIIIGTLIPLHIHLQENNAYFYCVRFIMGMQVLFLIAEIGGYKERLQGRVMGSISHMFGVVAIILHLRLISSALAMGIGIPLSLWVFITIYYTCVMASIADYVPDFTLNDFTLNV